MAIALAASTLVSCGGGGGGGDDGEEAPPSGGTGADGVPIFWSHYGSSGGGGSSVRETSPDGGFIATCYISSDGYVVKTDKFGGMQWQKSFGGAGWDYGNSVEQTADGGYIVGGCTDCGLGTPSPIAFYLLKLDAGGNTSWEKTLTAASLLGVYAVREIMSNSTPDGYVFVGSDASQNIALIKTGPTGSVLWQKAFSCPVFGWDVGFAVEQTADGGYVIAGDCAGAEMWLIKTDSGGEKLWDKRLSPGEAFSVKQTADNGYIIAGRTTIRTFSAPAYITPGDAVVIKTDQNGNQVWKKTFGGVEDDEARSVAVTRDGGYILAGKTLSYGSGPVNYNMSWQWEDVFLIKLDANGNTLWQKVKGYRHDISDGGTSVDAVSDGGYIVTGNSNAYSNGTLLLMKTDKNGNTVNLGSKDLTITVPGTMGVINFANAVAVATAGVEGLLLPRDVGTQAVDILIAAANDESICSAGSYTATLNPAGPVAEGTVLAASFTECVTGQGENQLVLNGTVTVTVESMTGDFSSDYTVQTTISPINITSVEVSSSITNTISGGMRFRREAVSGVHAELSQSITSPAPETLVFTVTENGIPHTQVIGPFTLSDSMASSGTGSYSFGDPGDSATLSTDVVSGELTVSVPQPIEGEAGDEPASGSFRIVASDNSRLTGTVTAGDVTLAVDTDGDGTDDGNLSTTWSVLY